MQISMIYCERCYHKQNPTEQMTDFSKHVTLICGWWVLKSRIWLSYIYVSIHTWHDGILIWCQSIEKRSGREYEHGGFDGNFTIDPASARDSCTHKNCGVSPRHVKVQTIISMRTIICKSIISASVSHALTIIHRKTHATQTLWKNCCKFVLWDHHARMLRRILIGQSSRTYRELPVR